MTVALFAFAVTFLIRRLVRRFRRPNFTGKLIWLTGASSGIGEALAYELSRLGARLILSSRNTKELYRVQNACASPDKIRVVQMDFSQPDKVISEGEKFVKELEKNGEKIDILIANAGISQLAKFMDNSF